MLNGLICTEPAIADKKEAESENQILPLEIILHCFLRGACRFFSLPIYFHKIQCENRYDRNNRGYAGISAALYSLMTEEQPNG